MKITASALSLNVPDPEASAAFLVEHFGFAVEMSADGFVSLGRPDAGFGIVYLRTGLSTFKPERIAGSAGEGLLVVFVVDDIDAEYERVRAEGVPIVTPIETEPWGERYFQTLDPNGIVIQLVQWVEAPPGSES
ncbi:putative enzyme related to lactoylglutathione lyase [Nocardia transvalensis]|uniref:Putative enzyme related to lactoylglutathione lyase n=1 Tax=Nocardia transvalensis TaxID=37333 RepID=A0A7W9UID0_9NOCA|nr:VOC family protein [Nocardia transvalensis]MBB5914283.1 putative enzyme related to lactoylglutathione lyase [Nocardia transvalensis]